MTALYFNQATHYWRGRSKKIRCVTIHVMVCPETAHRARWCVDWFASTGAPLASTHYTADSAETCQGVHEDDTAFTTPGVNADGVGVEHAGYANQSRAEWRDHYSTAMLLKSAKLVAGICRRHGIPPRRLSNAQLRAGASGIIGHKQASDVYGGTHWDPGPNFPWRWYIRQVRKFHDGSPNDGVLSVGDRGRKVKNLQRHLNRKHGEHLTVDGVYGAHTKDAVERLQREIGVKVDGAYGPISKKTDQVFHKRPHKPRASRDTHRDPVKHHGAPRFPLRKGHAYARNNWTKWTHSGYRKRDRDEIRKIQRKVGVDADGRYGPRTQAAVERFQRHHHLTVDGQVGPATWKELFA